MDNFEIANDHPPVDFNEKYKAIWNFNMDFKESLREQVEELRPVLMRENLSDAEKQSIKEFMFCSVLQNPIEDIDGENQIGYIQLFLTLYAYQEQNENVRFMYKLACEMYFEIYNSRKRTLMYRIVCPQFILRYLHHTDPTFSSKVVLRFNLDMLDEDVSIEMKVNLADTLLNCANEELRGSARRYLRHIGRFQINPVQVGPAQGNRAATKAKNNSIYNDRQNVHASKVNDSVIASLRKLNEIELYANSKEIIDIYTELCKEVKANKELKMYALSVWCVNANTIEISMQKSLQTDHTIDQLQKTIESVFVDQVKKPWQIWSFNKQSSYQTLNSLPYITFANTDDMLIATVDIYQILQQKNSRIPSAFEGILQEICLTMKSHELDDSKVKYSFDRIKIDHSAFGESSMSLKTICVKLWNKIRTDKKNRIELLKRFYEELTDMHAMCASGHMSRLVNVLSGFDANFQVEISFADEIYASCAALFEKSITSLENKDLAGDLSLGMMDGADLEERLLYKKFVVKAIPIQYETMLKDYTPMFKLSFTKYNFDQYFTNSIGKLQPLDMKMRWQNVALIPVIEYDEMESDFKKKIEHLMKTMQPQPTLNEACKRVELDILEEYKAFLISESQYQFVSDLTKVVLNYKKIHKNE